MQPKVANNCLLADNIQVSQAIFHVINSPIKTPAHQFLLSNSLFIGYPFSLLKHLVYIWFSQCPFIRDKHRPTRQATTDLLPMGYVTLPSEEFTGHLWQSLELTEGNFHPGPLESSLLFHTLAQYSDHKVLKKPAHIPLSRQSWQDTGKLHIYWRFVFL